MGSRLLRGTYDYINNYNLYPRLNQIIEEWIKKYIQENTDLVRPQGLNRQNSLGFLEDLVKDQNKP